MFDSADLLNKVFDAIGVGICVTDEDGVYVSVNQQYCRLYGYREEELLGHPFTMVFEPDKRTDAMRLYKKLMAADTSYPDTFKWRRVGKDGTSFYVASSGYLFTTKPGRRYRATIVRDISQIISNQNQIEFQAKILQNVKDGVVVTDFAGKVLYWNDAATEMFGLSGEEMLGQDIRRLNSRYEGNSYLQRLSHKNSFDSEWQYTLPEGESRWFNIRVTPLYDDLQNIVGFIGVSKDITSRKENEAERERLLEEAQILNEELRASEEELRQNLEKTIELNDFILKNERKFRSLTEKAFDAILLYDKEGKVTYASPSVETMLGYSHEELIGRYGSSLVHQEEMTEIDRLVWNLYEHPGEKIHMEHRAIRKDNSSIWVEVVMTNLLHDRSVQGVVSNFRDITEKKASEQKLQENETSLYMAQQMARLGSWELILETQQLKWSSGISQILDLGDVEHLESTADFYRYIHPHDRPLIRRLMNRQLQEQEEKELSFEICIVSAAGHLKYARLMSKLMFNKAGQPFKLIGTLQDITQQKKTEQEINSYAERFRLATQAAQLGIWDWQIEKDELIWDEQMYSLYGMQPQNVSYESWRKVLHPDDADVQENILLQTIREKQHYDTEYRIVLPSQEIRWIKAYAKIFYDNRQKPVRMIGVNWDITPLKKTEENLRRNNEELLKANDELDHFVYRTSHNLRAPLTSILGIVDLIQHYSRPEEYKDYLQLIEKSVKKMDETIHEITDYSKNTRVGLKHEKIHFKSLIGEITEHMNFLNDTDKIRVITDVPASIDFVSDSSRLKIIFNNVIFNAARYYNPHQPNPFIRISVQKTPQGITAHIQDNGIGIGQEHLDKVFDMFYRASPASTGSGLGLYIVKETVHKLKGTISIRSVLGEGTELTLQLPDLRNTKLS